MFFSFYNNEIIVIPKCWQFNCLSNKYNLQCQEMQNKKVTSKKVKTPILG